MRCPYCMNADTQVKDSRPTEDNSVIRRRRVCADCGGRFTTFERIQLRELTIVKNTGRKVPFERDKLMRSVQIALRKRPVEAERIERMVSGIVRRLENLGETEIPAKMVGELVMEGHSKLLALGLGNTAPCGQDPLVFVQLVRFKGIDVFLDIKGGVLRCNLGEKPHRINRQSAIAGLAAHL